MILVALKKTQVLLEALPKLETKENFVFSRDQTRPRDKSPAKIPYWTRRLIIRTLGHSFQKSRGTETDDQSTNPTKTNTGIHT